MPDSESTPALVWFRNDLRLEDNPALNAAVNTGRPVLCLYILEQDSDLRDRGGASRWWLHKSLESLSADIESAGGRLILRAGDAQKALIAAVEDTEADAVFWNRRYGAAEREVDSAIKSALKDKGLRAESFNGSLLTEPWTIETQSGGHYRVFSPYWRAVQACYSAPSPAKKPKELAKLDVASDDLADWELLPTSPNWADGFEDVWAPGEAGAQERLKSFLESPVNQYKIDRNRPDLKNGTSGLSPHLHFGEIGPAQIWRATQSRIDSGEVNEKSARVFLSEIGWREFSYVQLFQNPDLATENYNDDFDNMPWRDDEDGYVAWTKGRTGYPIVDAGMRQLWHTGWMHNRVRMIVASFLTKHLLVHWQRGEDWFWDTLVDADPASNSASWQWTAGSGADAAPYFRVFNPITQGQKFDETGDYVRQWVPELADLPTKHIHAPWEAYDDLLSKAGVTLGETYPYPIIEHKKGRERALDAYETLKNQRDAA